MTARAKVMERGLIERSPALEMLGQHHGIRLSRPLQPFRGQPVAEPPIALGQHGIRALAQERVPERQLLLPRKAALTPAHQDLQRHERLEPGRDLAQARLAADERRHPACPELRNFC
ncbi:hypothetical protein WMF30_05915 [Sorangium sp. So ce134]